MKIRSRTDIINDILDAANGGGGATKTKIMYRAYLSFTQMKEYVRVLTENNLLRYDVYTQTFKITQKGLRFLDTYNQINDAIKISPPQPQQQKQV
jgi:predicted transcriptional regulator